MVPIYIKHFYSPTYFYCIFHCFPTDFVDQQVRLDMFEFVTGTIEQTAAIVTAVLYELAYDQNIQNRLREHLDCEMGDEHQQITIDQLERMTYLENVLRGKSIFLSIENSNYRVYYLIIFKKFPTILIDEIIMKIE